MMRRHWLLYATIVLVCLPGIAKAETGVTDGAIKIGSLYAVTGANAQYGLARTSTKMAFDEINRKGGINGRKIELVIEDGACDRAKSVAAVKKLLHSDQVFALFGGVCSTAVKAATQSTIEAKVPWFVLSPAAQNIMDPFTPYVFGARPSSFDQTDVLVRASKQSNYKRIALMSSSDDYGVQARKGVEKAAPRLGLQLVAAEVHNFGDTDFTPQLLKIQAANPDAILITSYLKEIAIILRQSYELGLKAPRLATASVTTTIEKIVPKEALDNLIAVTPLKDVEDGPTFASFRQALKDAAPDLAAQPGMPDYLVIMGYYNVSIFAEGLKRAGRDLTREKFITALESINNFDTGALGGKVSFSKTDHDGLRSLGYYRYTLDKASGTLGRKFIGTIDLR